MIELNFDKYNLLLSFNPCEIFTHFVVTEMHGLSLPDCLIHTNNTKQAYIAGLCNYVPKASGDYTKDNENFVFINLSRCTDDIHTTGLVMHEMMHLSFDLHTEEEELIGWAEKETYKIVKIIKKSIAY